MKDASLACLIWLAFLVLLTWLVSKPGGKVFERLIRPAIAAILAAAGLYSIIGLFSDNSVDQLMNAAFFLTPPIALAFRRRRHAGAQQGKGKRCAAQVMPSQPRRVEFLHSARERISLGSYQGMALAVPQFNARLLGFSPW